MLTPHDYEKRVVFARQNVNQKPYLIFRQRSNEVGVSDFRPLYCDNAFEIADYVSTCNYTRIDGKDVPFSCLGISFDIDLKGTDQQYHRRCHNGKIVVSHRSIRLAIKARFPELAPFITFITSSRNDGLSIFMAFPGFPLSFKRMAHMALSLQIQIGTMLLSLGIGVDKAAYGLVRDIPNFYNPKFRRYKNAKKRYSKKAVSRKDQDGNPIRNILSELLAVTKKYKSVWDQSRKANPDKYLYVNSTIETMLANLYHQGFQSQTFRSQVYACEFLDIAIPTFRNWLKNGNGPRCLTIEHTLAGYTLTLDLNAGEQKRAATLLKGEMSNWILPHPSMVLDGVRNEYVWRCAVTLKLMGFSEYKAVQIASELVKQMPGYLDSRNCKRVATIVGSIFRTRPYEPGRHGNLKPIPGLEGALLSIDKRSGNQLSGDLKVEDIEAESLKPKNLIPFDLNQIVPSMFTVSDRNGRLTEDVLDQSQKDKHRIAMQTFLKPSINSILSQNVYAYVDGRSHPMWQKKNAQLNHVFNHRLQIDIQKFYPSIDQTILKSKMLETLGSEITEVIFAAVTADRVYNGEIQKRESGIPEGSTFSNILSNLYLNGFDHWLEAEGLSFTRYADDIRIFSHSKEKLVSTLEAIKQYLKENLKLNLNENKTQFLECGDVV